MIKLYQTIKEWCGHAQVGGCRPQILTAETSVKSPKLVELKKAIGLSEIPSTSTFELRGFVVFGYEASVFCREFPKITKKKSDSWHFHTSSPRFPGCLVEQRKPCPYEATQENVAFAHHSDDGNAIVRRFMKLPKWVCSKMRDPHPRTSSCNNGQWLIL